MRNTINRRKFLGTAVASGIVTVIPRHVLGGKGYVAPSEKITLAHIGMGTQGFNELGALLSDPGIQVVSVCDPNKASDDYVEWGKNSTRNRIRAYLGQSNWSFGNGGCPGGREIGRKVVDTYYVNNRSSEKFKGCSTYIDFRELLENEKDLDAVKVMTPDHLHATISIAAMRKGKHVLMHKPVANRIHEGRLVLKTARETQMATHLLAHGSGAGNALIIEEIKKGVIGNLRETHNWTNRPVWPQYTEIPTDRPPVTKGLDWNMWLGPALFRPYHPHYTHTVFRGWYDFGGGSMADMGIYSLWPIFSALNLDSPMSARAWATHTCAIKDNVSRPTKNDFSYPSACTLRFRFAAEGSRPAWDLFWYDGGMKPRLPEELEDQDVQLSKEGILFIGDHGAILAGFHGQSPRLITKGENKPLQLTVATSQSRESRRSGGLKLWTQAIRGVAPSPGSFLNTAAITDTVNLGTVALRTGKKVLFDSQNMKITNVAEANNYLFREYREGWKL